MGNEDRSNLLPGSHTHSVARLDVGEIYSISRPFEPSQGATRTPNTIARTRSLLAHSATALFGRVKEKLPERQFTVNTGVLAADNRLYITAIIHRVK